MHSDALDCHDVLQRGPIPWCAFHAASGGDDDATLLPLVGTNPAFDALCLQCSGELVTQVGLSDLITDSWALHQLGELCQLAEQDALRIPVVLGAQSYELCAYQLGDGYAACQWLETSAHDHSQTKALMRREAAFMNLLVNLNIGVVVHQPDTSISFSNMAASEMLCLSTQQMQGKAAIDPEWCFIDENGAPMELADYPVMRVLSTREPLGSYVVGVQRPNQETCWVWVAAYPEFDDQHQLLQVVVTFTNITERKQAEQEHRRLHEHLAQAQRVESLGRLAGGIAHDFNNMLAVIQGQSEMALQFGSNDERITRHIQQIRQAAERSARLTSQLLAYARKQTAQPKIIDLNRSIERSLELLRRMIGHRMELRWIPSDHKVFIKIDPVQLDQILTNLCVNARDAITDHDNGIVTISTEQIDRDGEPFIQLRVADNGCGISEKVLAHIFEPFFTTKSLDEGTGLGLATVQGIVRQNDGLIRASSRLGQGTVFDIELPDYTPESGCDRKDPASGQRNQRRKCVMIIEDERSLLEMLHSYLTTLGYMVVSARDAEEARSGFEKHGAKIDLLICDVVMPGPSGGELAMEFRSKRPDLHCLFMSGYGQDIMRGQGLLEQGHQFIAKPFTLTQLGEKIEAALRHIGSGPPAP